MVQRRVLQCGLYCVQLYTVLYCIVLYCTCREYCTLMISTEKNTNFSYMVPPKSFLSGFMIYKFAPMGPCQMSCM